MIRLLFSAFFLLVQVQWSEAHELRPAYLDIRETAPDSFKVVWKVPARGDSRMGLYAVLPDQCRAQSEVVKSIEGNAYLERWATVCKGGLKGGTIRIEGLKATLTDVLTRIEYIDGTVEMVRLKADTPLFTATGAQSFWEVAWTYTRLGVEHILAGIDHLLFVLALLLLVSDTRSLIKTITAFTVAHSITLSGAVLGYLSLPPRPVEVLIAFSIVFVAVELVKLKPDEPRLSERCPWLVAFPFGLLHGFGFAGALMEIGLPQGDVPLALAAFNIGVELGQLLFMAAMAVLWKSAAAILPFSPSSVRIAAAYVIGVVAASWLLLRLDGVFA